MSPSAVPLPLEILELHPFEGRTVVYGGDPYEDEVERVPAPAPAEARSAPPPAVS